SANYSKVFEAMNNGALDAVDTPSLTEQKNIVPFLKKIERLGLVCKPISRNEIKSSIVKKNLMPSAPNLVVIGASTGGPATICQTLSTLPAGFNAAVVIIQQVDQAFAAGLASWIGENINMKTCVAVDGEIPEPGNVYLAATNDHLIITEDLKFKYVKEPESAFSRPSVNVFFESVAANWPGTGTAVILTGVGNDGAEGLLRLKNKGWNTIAQDQESSLVFGMPRAAVDNNAAQAALPPSIIGRLLYESYSGN
ncbi:MAG: chemotaxis protein CheB, partial [Victivallaceae bacterium]